MATRPNNDTQELKQQMSELEAKLEQSEPVEENNRLDDNWEETREKIHQALMNARRELVINGENLLKSYLDGNKDHKLLVKSIESFNNAERLAVGDFKLFHNVGKAYQLLGVHCHAIAYLEEAHKLNPGDPETTLQLTESYIKNREFKKCLPLLLELKKGEKYNSNVALRLGTTYRHLKEFDKSVKTLEEAMEKDPTNFIIQRNIGNVRLAEGKLDEAIAAYQKIPEDAEKEYLAAVVSMGNVYIAKDNHARAVEEYQKVPKSDIRIQGRFTIGQVEKIDMGHGFMLKMPDMTWGEFNVYNFAQYNAGFSLYHHLNDKKEALKHFENIPKPGKLYDAA